MAKISKVNIYPLQSPVIQPQDYWIGTEFKSGLTKNFRAQDVASFTAIYLGLAGNVSTGLISVDSITSIENTVEFLNAVYRINGTEYGPISGEVEIEPEEEGFYRTDILIGNDVPEILLVQGDPSEVNPVQPALPQGTVLIGVLNVFGPAVEPEIPPSTTGWKVYGSLVYLKRQGNTNPSIIQVGDIVFGMMADNNTLINGGAYTGGGDYYDAANYYANPLDFSAVPPTNLP